MSNDKNYKIHTCYHCGNHGLMKIEHTMAEAAMIHLEIWLPMR